MFLKSVSTDRLLQEAITQEWIRGYTESLDATDVQNGHMEEWCICAYPLNIVLNQGTYKEIFVLFYVDVDIGILEKEATDSMYVCMHEWMDLIYILSH